VVGLETLVLENVFNKNHLEISYFENSSFPLCYGLL